MVYQMCFSSEKSLWWSKLSNFWRQWLNVRRCCCVFKTMTKVCVDQFCDVNDGERGEVV